MRRLLKDFDLDIVDGPTTMQNGNQGRISLAGYESMNYRTEHIYVRYYYTREAVYQ